METLRLALDVFRAAAADSALFLVMEAVEVALVGRPVDMVRVELTLSDKPVSMAGGRVVMRERAVRPVAGNQPLVPSAGGLTALAPASGCSWTDLLVAETGPELSRWCRDLEVEVMSWGDSVVGEVLDLGTDGRE